MQSMGRIGTCLLVLLVILIFSLKSDAPSLAQSGLPRYGVVDCSVYGIPAGTDVTCGTLTVPEDHNAPGSPDIRLAFAILKSRSSTPAPDPILYLAGGPGISPLGQYSGLARLVQPFLEKRDVILLDQRGVGFSEPALNCWEITNVDFDNLGMNLAYEARTALRVAAAEQCGIRQMDRGINLSAYHTTQSAADVEALRDALGYEQWNLYGISYGTRLALVTLRDYPAGIRSVILDSPYPPQVNFYSESIPAAIRAFDALFERCAADPACSAAYPDLRNVFFSLLAQLDSAPITVSTAYPGTDRRYDVVINHDSLVRAMEGDLYYPGDVRYLPFMIYEARSGRYDLWAEQIIDGFASSRLVFSNGVYLANDCHEETPFTSFDDALASAGGNPAVGYPILYSDAPSFEICEKWGIRAAEASEKSPVYSDVPALVLTWQFDPVMAPDWSRLTASTLSHSFLVEFPGIGHGVFRSAGECGRNMAADFLDDPSSAPDTGCIEKLIDPDFFVP